jgi:hypothetical protein
MSDDDHACMIASCVPCPAHLSCDDHATGSRRRVQYSQVWWPNKRKFWPFSSSPPGIAVRRTASLRSPMVRWWPNKRAIARSQRVRPEVAGPMVNSATKQSRNFRVETGLLRSAGNDDRNTEPQARSRISFHSIWATTDAASDAGLQRFVRFIGESNSVKSGDQHSHVPTSQATKIDSTDRWGTRRRGAFVSTRELNLTHRSGAQ